MRRALQGLFITPVSLCSLMRRASEELPITAMSLGSRMHKALLRTTHALHSESCEYAGDGSSPDHKQHKLALCELTSQGLSPPPYQPPPGPGASLASSAWCLDCPSHPFATSVEHHAEACPPPSPGMITVPAAGVVVSTYRQMGKSFFSPG